MLIDCKSKLLSVHIRIVMVLFLSFFTSISQAKTTACIGFYDNSQNALKVDPYADKKSPLAPKPLPVRIVQNVYRWYLKKDPRDITAISKEKDYNYLSDLDYLSEKRQQSRLGLVRSFFSHEFDTRIYYTATAKPDINGHIPVVNKQAKALYFYFHGSGTGKASGANFAYKMNRLAAMGYAVIAIDLPYHSEGTRKSSSQRSEVFYEQLRKMIHSYAIDGMPVYLAGHSFGPEIVAEYFARYPHDKYVKGGLMISPASFNSVLEDWFMNKTAHMTALWGDMVTNEDGAAWAGLLSSQHIWKKERNGNIQDPTLTNTDFKLRILTGEYEEYAPGPLDSRGLPTKEKREYSICKALLKLFRNSLCKTEPGVGHYIFEHLDENGHDVILRELLALDGESIANEKSLKQEAIKENEMNEVYDLAKRFSRDNAMKSFVISNYEGAVTIRNILQSSDLSLAKKIQMDFSRYVTPQREVALIENIVNSKRWAMDFYKQNEAEIVAIDLKKPKVSDSLLNKYLELLEQTPENVLRNYALAPENVFTIPEKKAPTQEQIEKAKERKKEEMLKKQKKQNETNQSKSSDEAA